MLLVSGISAQAAIKSLSGATKSSGCYIPRHMKALTSNAANLKAFRSALLNDYLAVLKTSHTRGKRTPFSMMVEVLSVGTTYSPIFLGLLVVVIEPVCQQSVWARRSYLQWRVGGVGG